MGQWVARVGRKWPIGRTSFLVRSRGQVFEVVAVVLNVLVGPLGDANPFAVVGRITSE